MVKDDISNRKAMKKSVLFELLASRTGLGLKTVKKLYEAFFMIIVSELRNNGIMELPDICKITAQTIEGQDKIMFGEYKYVAEHIRLRIKPKDRLIDYVNGRLVTKMGRRRLRRNQLTKKDKLLNKMTQAELKNDVNAYITNKEEEYRQSEGKSWTYVAEEEMVEMIANYSGFPKSVVRTMRKAESKAIRLQLKNQYTLCYGNIGKFSLRFYEARPSYQVENNLTGETVWTKEREAQYRPYFKVRPVFKKEIRELTEGNFV